MRKVRQAFEAQVKIDRRCFLLLIFDQVFSFCQASVLQPLPWWYAEGLLKIAFKTSEAAAGQLGEFLYRDIELVVAAHEPFQIDLMRF